MKILFENWRHYLKEEKPLREMFYYDGPYEETSSIRVKKIVSAAESNDRDNIMQARNYVRSRTQDQVDIEDVIDKLLARYTEIIIEELTLVTKGMYDYARPRPDDYYDRLNELERDMYRLRDGIGEFIAGNSPYKDQVVQLIEDAVPEPDYFDKLRDYQAQQAQEESIRKLEESKKSLLYYWNESIKFEEQNSEAPA
jgi:hypothetical protein